MDFKKLTVLLVTGFVAAVIADLDAWRRGANEAGTFPPFDFARAFPRWVAGALSGVAGYFGLGA